MQAYIASAESKWRPIFNNIMSFREAGEDGPAGFRVIELKRYINVGLKKDKVSDADVSDIFVDLDVEGKGFVSQPVFVKEMSKLPRREAFESAFDMQDYNRDGMLSAKEIQDAFDMVGVDKERSAKFFKQVDTNKDGKITKAEFMKMV